MEQPKRAPRTPRPPWTKQVAEGIGERVAYYRDQRKLSAKQLAEQCADLGLPSLNRLVITKLENGRREAVSTAELTVLARALNVPPVLLLFPLGRADTVEVLPGIEADPYAALEWFTGISADPADRSAMTIELAEGALVMWNEHYHHDGQLAIIDDAIEEERALLANAAGEDQAKELGERLTRTMAFKDTTVQALRRVRLNMRNRGLTPPPLRPETARILGPEPGQEAPHGPR